MNSKWARQGRTGEAARINLFHTWIISKEKEVAMNVRLLSPSQFASFFRTQPFPLLQTTKCLPHHMSRPKFVVYVRIFLSTSQVTSNL